LEKVSSDHSPDFIVFIDEAGDPGLRTVKPLDPNGSSEWFVLGAAVIRQKYEPVLHEWVSGIRDAIRDKQGSELHFRRLSDVRKQIVCKQFTKLEVGAFVLASHKPNMVGYRNLDLDSVPETKNWFYHWCVRLLLERVTDACARIAPPGKNSRIKIVFSRRGGIQYNWLRTYLEVLMQQGEQGRTLLTKRTIRHQMLSRELIENVPSRGSPGCQLADIVASAFYSAVNTGSSRWHTRAAELLKPRISKEAGFFFDYGVTLFPPPRFDGGTRLNTKQKEIFRFYDYNI
jgi:hypothetical protein